MDRKEFLKIAWNKLLKPILILLVIAFFIRYIIKVFAENGTERLLTILVLGFGFLSLLSYAIGVLFSKAVDLIKSKLNDKTKFRLRVIEKILNFIGTLSFGALLYHFFIKDRIQAVIITIIFLILYAVDILKKEKN